MIRKLNNLYLEIINKIYLKYINNFMQKIEYYRIYILNYINIYNNYIDIH